MTDVCISEVQITPVKPKDGLEAFASVVVNEAIFLGSIGVHCRHDGTFRIVYPAKKVGERNLNIYHPINRNVGRMIQEAIIGKCQQIFERSDDHHDRYHQASDEESAAPGQR